MIALLVGTATTTQSLGSSFSEISINPNRRSSAVGFETLPVFAADYAGLVHEEGAAPGKSVILGNCHNLEIRDTVTSIRQQLELESITRFHAAGQITGDQRIHSQVG